MFSELVFTLLHCPTTPIVFDTVGYCHEFLFENLLVTKPAPILASEYLCEEKMLFGMQNPKTPFFVYDLSDYLSAIYGRIIDRPIFQRVIQNMPKLSVNAITKAPMSLPLVNIFSSQLEFCFNNEYKATCTVINANSLNKNEAWIEIKEVLLKHFLPDNYSKLVLIRSQLIKLKQSI